MGIEVERKFLVVSGAWRDRVRQTIDIVQGYLANTTRSSTRVRIADGHATLSVKGMTPGASRPEFEYPIPVSEAREMLRSLCEGPLLEKRRHLVDVGSHCYEIDEFTGANTGLVVAEVELARADEPFARPGWLGDEVTDSLRYYNFRLVHEPFDSWPEADQEAARAGRHREQRPGGQS